jgi:hypothetical protein
MAREGASASARLTLAVLTAAGVIAAASARADGPQGVDEPLTRFERFALAGCTPCVKESVPIATVAVPAVKLAALVRAAAGRVSRAGEIGVEVLRAYQLGRASRQMLALRVTLSIPTGNPGEMYRLASGVVDEDEVAGLAVALREIAQTASAPTAPAPGTETMEIDVHTGSVRLGILRLRENSVAYVQAGDIHLLARRPVWEAPGTLYLPPTELPALVRAIAEAAAKVQSMRGAQ